MSRFKGSFTVKLNVSASIKKETKIKLPLLVIKSGIFPDARHYAKNITAVNLYAVLLYGTRDGRIPSRNVLEFLFHKSDLYSLSSTISSLSIYTERN